ncbi:MAG TPA: hypothetical protein VGL91_07660 [Acidobacteriota bacterium]|jgi:hypothetical protein
MKVVIQCSATKDQTAGSFSMNGRRVKFVAHPELHEEASSRALFRPDDMIPSMSNSWRTHLLTYNRRADNPDHLLGAADLYSPPVYRRLLNHIGPESLFILSAGWGLIRSDFLLPEYDITFSSQGEPWKRRTKTDPFSDFAHLTESDIAHDESVYFFGGRNYLPLYYRLTCGLMARKVVYFTSTNISTDQGFHHIRYGSAGTNWHYRCAGRSSAGALSFHNVPNGRGPPR